MIEAKGICKTFPNGVKAVREVSLTIEPGRIYCIMGKSGSGKTTLLQLLGLLDPPTKGELRIDGQPAHHLSDEQSARLRNQRIGFIFQSFYLHPFLTALENVMVPMLINDGIPKKAYRERAAALLYRVDMAHRTDHYPRELSGGEQQRVAIARALANDPTYLFADEPTGSLDDENEQNILRILKEIAKENKAVVLVTHDQTVEEIAHVKYRLAGGRLEGGRLEGEI